MADTINTCIAYAQLRLPDATSGSLLNIADLVHREILTYIPGLLTLGASGASINLTQGTYEYTLAEAQMQVDEAEYLPSAGATPPSSKLMETTVEILNKQQPGWREAAQGVPTQFYIASNGTGGVVGLYPNPNASTNAGYPIVNIYGSNRPVSPLIGSSTVPNTCLSSDVYIEGMCYYASIQIRPQMAAAFKATYMEQIDLNRKYLETRNDGLREFKQRNSRYQQIPTAANPVNPA